MDITGALCPESNFGALGSPTITTCKAIPIAGFNTVMAIVPGKSTTTRTKATEALFAMKSTKTRIPTHHRPAIPPATRWLRLRLWLPQSHPRLGGLVDGTHG